MLFGAQNMMLAAFASQSEPKTEDSAGRAAYLSRLLGPVSSPVSWKHHSGSLFVLAARFVVAPEPTIGAFGLLESDKLPLEANGDNK